MSIHRNVANGEGVPLEKQALLPLRESTHPRVKGSVQAMYQQLRAVATSHLCKNTSPLRALIESATSPTAVTGATWPDVFHGSDTCLSVFAAIRQYHPDDIESFLASKRLAWMVLH